MGPKAEQGRTAALQQKNPWSRNAREETIACRETTGASRAGAFIEAEGLNLIERQRYILEDPQML